MSNQPLNNMDKRCPRRLSELPDRFCPLAVLRLKALRHADHELTEEEENNLPGCPWAMNHQLANYCFFNFLEWHMPSKTLSETEIAHFCNLSIDTVKKVERKGLASLKKSPVFKEIIDVYDGDKIIDDSRDESEWEVPIK